jgi:hypothetical protein
MGCFAIFMSVLNLAGICLLGGALWTVWHAARSANWPTTPGLVTDLTLKENADASGTTYEVHVEYSYTVEGTDYRASRLGFGYWASNDQEVHSKIYEKLKAARTVDVRYDPADPAISVLSFGLHPSVWLILSFAITWLAFVAGFSLIIWWASCSDNLWVQNLSVN